MIISQFVYTVDLDPKSLTCLMLMGTGLNSSTHECRFVVKVKIGIHTGVYRGEVLKGSNIPDGRGVLYTKEGQLFFRHFRNGQFAQGNTLYVNLNDRVGGVFGSKNAGPESQLFDIGIMYSKLGNVWQGAYTDDFEYKIDMFLSDCEYPLVDCLDDCEALQHGPRRLGHSRVQDQIRWGGNTFDYFGELNEANQPHGLGIKFCSNGDIHIQYWTNGNDAETGKSVVLYINGTF